MLCPNCYARVPLEDALICEVCGYVLRMPALGKTGLIIIAIAEVLLLMYLVGLDRFPFLDVGGSLSFIVENYLTMATAVLVVGGFLTFASVLHIRRLSTSRRQV